MYVHQDALNNGGNANQQKTYINKENNLMSLARNLELKIKKSIRL
jgi:hypothetical protein